MSTPPISVSRSKAPSPCCRHIAECPPFVNGSTFCEPGLPKEQSRGHSKGFPQHHSTWHSKSCSSVPQSGSSLLSMGPAPHRLHHLSLTRLEVIYFSNSNLTSVPCSALCNGSPVTCPENGVSRGSVYLCAFICRLIFPSPKFGPSNREQFGLKE